MVREGQELKPEATAAVPEQVTVLRDGQADCALVPKRKMLYFILDTRVVVLVTTCGPRYTRGTLRVVRGVG